MKLGDVVYVRWVDSIRWTQGWESTAKHRRQMAAHSPEQETVGFLVWDGINAIGVVLCRSMHVYEDGAPHAQLGITIPRAAIVYSKVLGE